jgi:hypothetical protein
VRPAASASLILLSVVPVSVPIPRMVMLPAAGTAVQVPVKVTPALVVRCYPPCRRINRASPISGVPLVTVSSCIPVALYPYEIGTRGWRQDPHLTRGRRGPIWIPMEIWPKANAAERINSVHSFFTTVLPDVSLRDSVHQIVIHLVNVRPISFQTPAHDHGVTSGAS